MDVSGEDPIERVMGNTVEKMTAIELVTYMKVYLAEMYGFELVVDPIIDRKVMEHFQSRYPDGRAGRIVQHVMLRHGGKKDGQYIRTANFSKGMKWWTDQMWAEVQEAELRAARKQTAPATAADEGWFDLSRLGEL